jgi:hypothetical protein
MADQCIFHYSVFPLAPELGVSNPDDPSYGVTDPGVGMILNYEHGKPRGPVWIQLRGGGFLHGRVSKKGQFTGNEVRSW